MAANASNDLHIVVGSGPAGVACAKGLLERGAHVLMIDGGVGLEAERESLVGRMRQRPFAEWEAAQIAALKEGTSATAKGIPLKRVYGSDFPYRECDEHVPATYENVGVRPSLAAGGLSNVWGAAMMPYRQADLGEWPIGEKELAPHYASVLKFTGLSARHDELEKFFPTYLQSPLALKLSSQAERLMQRLGRRQQELEQNGIHFGQARIAVRAADEKEAKGCVYCGMCMYGCVYGCIYNSADTLAQMRSQNGFEYRPGVVVTRVEESPTGATIHGHERNGGQPISITGSRVYLGAGVIPSTGILLRSKNAFDETVWMRDSQYFLFPLAMLRGSGAVEKEQLQTLSQIFLEILDRAISPFTVHVQVYSYNDLIGQAVRGAMGPMAGPLGFLARALEGRLLILQGYLHSEHSAKIGVTLRKPSGESGASGGGRSGDRLELRAELNPATRPMIRQVLKKLARHRGAFGGVPLSPMLQVAEPGRGFHTGGTFPMAKAPGPRETDVLGRPFGWQRVHVVDSTVLPSIPATTITFSVMANAHRIAVESIGQ